MELARSLELRSGAYHAPALPVELYQRSWRGDSNADHGLTRPALFPLSYTSKILERSTGIAPVLPDWRSGVLLLYELRLERAARVELASSGWRPEAPAAIPCSLQQTLAVATGVEPVPPDRQSGILPLDSATTQIRRGFALWISPRGSYAAKRSTWMRGQDSNLHEPGQSR